ncbi:MAG TPA: NUDIX domain-containing protein [Terriglobales bacterium]|nr:NUDIX domain-containing protein [Terriglobales bacterium]
MISTAMQQIAQILLFDRNGKLLIYLRDDKPEIPFPNYWDFFGGHVEAGETPEAALARELKEELDLDLHHWQFFRRYECLHGDAYPNIKFIYSGAVDRTADDLTLYEGQRLTSIAADERHRFRFANILGAILEDFIAASFWPAPVDKF